MSQNIKFLSVAILVIAIGGSYLFPSVPKAVQQTVLGAVSTLDGVDNPYTSIGGYKEYRGTQSLTATSSFICSLRNPYNATSSIVALSAESTANGIGVTNALYISTSTSAYGTSTPALVAAFPMGTGQWSVEMAKNTASTTAGAEVLSGMTTNGTSNYILGPSEWITWKIATTTGGTFTSYNVGTCSAAIKKI